MRKPTRGLANFWLPCALFTTAALAIWALAAVHGYAWQLIWVPAIVAGASWPRGRTGRIGACLQRLQRGGRM